MSAERIFLDTAFVLALLNRRDRLHSRSRALLPRVRDAAEVWLTEAVLVEIGNAMAALDRAAAANFVSQCYQTTNMRVVSVDTPLILRSLEFYRNRPDKSWGLTDCISFVVMREHELVIAATSDAHFRQAGYRALLAEGE